MESNRFVPLAMAIAGFAAISIGVFQGLVHVAPGYEGTIMSGWDGRLNHEEVLLVQLGALGVGSVVAGLRWKRVSGLSFVMGGVVLFYAGRAVVNLFQSSRPLYREFTMQGAGFEGETVMFVLGVEPFLLAAGGLLLIGAGLTPFTSRLFKRGGEETTPRPSRA
jgi:F0F1-type ATP synthase assembly protein I